MNVMVKIGLTDRKTFQSGTNVGHNDPIIHEGMVIAQRIKGTLGITAWYCLRVFIDGSGRDLDVGSTYPRAAKGAKG